MSAWEVLSGDCMERMAAMPDASVDAIVTDPPYSLGFMGKAWDSQHRTFEAAGDLVGRQGVRLVEGQRAQEWHKRWAREALRVLKPGGHLLAFGGTRTYHRLACAIEDAGFEIRDTICWLYGSGFPKSKNVGGGYGTALKPAFEPIVMARKPLVGTVEDNMRRTVGYAHGSSGESGTDEARYCQDCLSGLRDDVQGAALRRSANEGQDMQSPVSFGDDASREELALDRRSLEGQAGLRDRQCRGPGSGPRAPSSDGAHSWAAAEVRRGRGSRRWEQGEQQADESATLRERGRPHEQACPSGLCARCGRQIYGTGALNIDGCRLQTISEGPGATPSHDKNTGRTLSGGPLEWQPYDGSQGRWPANAVLSHTPECRLLGTRQVRGITGTRAGDSHGYIYGQGFPRGDGRKLGNDVENVEEWDCAEGCPVRMLDEQTGELRSAGIYDPGTVRSDNSVCFGSGLQQSGATAGSYADQGGASRFFYCPKASRSEREAGLKEVVQGALRNSHPTVKPIELMRWLVRLITPPGGLVLDPFAGSGSTGCAAVLEGFRFAGIEREPDYAQIARARIEFWSAQPDGIESADVLAADRVRTKIADTGQLSLGGL